jgi:ElaA protein
MRFTIKPFAELTVPELYEQLQLRQRVFVVEQNCPYLDCDGKDAAALHLWGALDDDPGTMVAYARLFAPGAKYPEACAIGRVVTAPEQRGRGLGRELMQEALRVTAARFPGAPVKIQAQAHLDRFYGELGFVVVSDVYLEDDIRHVDMVRAAR